MEKMLEKVFRHIFLGYLHCSNSTKTCLDMALSIFLLIDIIYRSGST